MTDENDSTPFDSSSSVPPQPLPSSDPSSPYFLNASDSPGSTLVTCLLQGENYPTWRRAMMNALRAKNKLSFVDGSITKPDESAADQQMWEKCNSMVIAWIFNALSPKLHNSVAYAESASEMWLDLQERLSQGNAPRIYELKCDISLMQQQDLTVVTYFTKLKAFWDELATYSVVLQCKCTAARELMLEKEGEKLYQFLMGLNDKFSVIRSQILNMEPLPNLNKAYALVVKEERQHNVVMGRATSGDAAAFIAKQPRARNSPSGRDPDKSKLHCTHCGKSGHLSE